MFSKKDTTRKLGIWPDPVTADIAAGTLKASGIDCETIEAQFGQCWKCATVKPAKP